MLATWVSRPMDALAALSRRGGARSRTRACRAGGRAGVRAHDTGPTERGRAHTLMLVWRALSAATSTYTPKTAIQMAHVASLPSRPSSRRVKAMTSGEASTFAKAMASDEASMMAVETTMNWRRRKRDGDESERAPADGVAETVSLAITCDFGHCGGADAPMMGWTIKPPSGPASQTRLVPVLVRPSSRR